MKCAKFFLFLFLASCNGGGGGGGGDGSKNPESKAPSEPLEVLSTIQGVWKRECYVSQQLPADPPAIVTIEIKGTTSYVTILHHEGFDNCNRQTTKLYFVRDYVLPRKGEGDGRFAVNVTWQRSEATFTDANTIPRGAGGYFSLPDLVNKIPGDELDWVAGTRRDISGRSHTFGTFSGKTNRWSIPKNGDVRYGYIAYDKDKDLFSPEEMAWKTDQTRGHSGYSEGGRAEGQADWGAFKRVK